jgi:hypothetical protein
MAAQEFSNIPPESQSAELAKRQLEEFRQQFPLGLAPYSRGNLMAFAFLVGFGDLFFWRFLSGLTGLDPVLFPGGIIAAGIAGSINLRRANQSSAIPKLLLNALVLALICAFIGVVITDQSASFQPSLTAGYRLMLFIAYFALGVIYAGNIARRQHLIYRRWQDRAGRPTGRDQGGCLSTFGWLTVIIVVVLVLGNLFYSVLVPGVAAALYPPQRYTVEGFSITAPAGWREIPASSIDMSCGIPTVSCLAIVRQSGTGSIALITLSAGLSPQIAANLLALPFRNSNPSLSDLESVPYTPETLTGHDAYTISADAQEGVIVFTSIADDDRLVSIQLVCVSTSVANCERLRDQFVSGLEFPSDSNGGV